MFDSNTVLSYLDLTIIYDEYDKIKPFFGLFNLLQTNLTDNYLKLSFVNLQTTPPVSNKFYKTYFIYFKQIMHYFDTNNLLYPKYIQFS